MNIFEAIITKQLNTDVNEENIRYGKWMIVQCNNRKKKLLIKRILRWKIKRKLLMVIWLLKKEISLNWEKILRPDLKHWQSLISLQNLMIMLIMVTVQKVFLQLVVGGSSSLHAKNGAKESAKKGLGASKHPTHVAQSDPKVA